MIVLIVLIIFAWIVCAVITAGVLMHIDPEEWGRDLQVNMLFCIAAWPMLVVAGIGYVLLTKLSKLSMVVYGFLDYIRKGDE